MAIVNQTKICDVVFFTKFGNPVSALAKILFNVDIEIGSLFKNARENSRRLHVHVKKYVMDRKSGVTKSQMEGFDLLSHYLENQDVFSDDDVVNNIIGMIFASIETTNFSSQTMLSFFAQRDDVV